MASNQMLTLDDVALTSSNTEKPFLKSFCPSMWMLNKCRTAFFCFQSLVQLEVSCSYGVI